MVYAFKQGGKALADYGCKDDDESFAVIHEMVCHID